MTLGSKIVACPSCGQQVRIEIHGGEPYRDEAGALVVPISARFDHTCPPGRGGGEPLPAAA